MNRIIIHEVGPRDGLQAESTIVPLEERVRWIDRITSSGIDVVQLGSFVSPQKMPQMAETDALFRHYSGTGKPPGVVLSALVLNEKGLQRGLACDVDMFCMGVSASRTHSLKNTGMTPQDALPQIVGMAKQAMRAGKRVQASVQSAFGCGYEGLIPAQAVLELVSAYLDAGVRNISLADTAGHAHPGQVEQLYGSVRELDPEIELACHFHNTYGLGLANCWAALKSGVTYFESAFGGLGGCPFTKVPAGNVSTEDLVHALQRMGLREDIRLDVLLDTARQVSAFFGRELPGLVMRSGSIVGFQGQGTREVA